MASHTYLSVLQMRKPLSKVGLWVGLALAPGALCASAIVESKDTRQAVREDPTPIVATSEGRVQGIHSNGVSQFLGVPYAAPPVGKFRWQPPQNHAPWDNVRQTTKFAPICALTTTLGVFSGPRNDNEDCLHLNIFTPSIHPAAPLPVIVYIHGGGNYDGETPGLDGRKLASLGRSVVVTVEYRLNLMGFLAHPALDSEGHPFGNYGILDQQAALQWVRRNIAKFGGDQHNVTVGGQSSGSVDVMIHMVSPFAKGLFQKAFCQSSCYASYPLATKADAEAKGVAFAQAAGCGSGAGPEVADCLRNLPAAKIEELAGTPSAISRFVISSGIVDGQIVPDQPITLFKNGDFSHVPLISGVTKDEWDFFSAVTEYWTGGGAGSRTPPADQRYLDYVKTTFSESKYVVGSAQKVLALYPLGSFDSPQAAWSRAASDQRICDARSLIKILAPQVPVYAYQFADQTAPSIFPDMPGLAMRAYHAADIQYVFPFWHGGPEGVTRPLNHQQMRLSDQIITAWANFARTGNPNGSGNNPWPRFTLSVGKPAWLIQDLPGLSSVTDRRYSSLHHCDFWDSIIAKP